MNRPSSIIVSLTLLACATHQAYALAPRTDAAVHTVIDGPATAAALTWHYMDTRANCGSDSQPAFLCSGVVLRSTTYSNNFDAWDPSPSSIKKGGISFSYLRKDNNFKRFVYDRSNSHGFIFYPVFETPSTKRRIQVLCQYPMDAGTDHRPQACGQFPGYPSSAPCHLQNILTGEQWAKQFPPGTLGRRTCAFDVRDSRNRLAGPAFEAALKAKSSRPEFFSEQNELVLDAWESGIGAQLPIQAFFYQNDAGRQLARLTKARFLSKTGIDLPLIKITLAQTASGTAKFEFIASDQ